MTASFDGNVVSNLETDEGLLETSGNVFVRLKRNRLGIMQCINKNSNSLLGCSLIHNVLDAQDAYENSHGGDGI